MRTVRYGSAATQSPLGRLRTAGMQKNKRRGGRESNSKQHDSEFFQFRTHNIHSFFKTPTPLTQANNDYRWLAR